MLINCWCQQNQEKCPVQYKLSENVITFAGTWLFLKVKNVYLTLIWMKYFCNVTARNGSAGTHKGNN